MADKKWKNSLDSDENWYSEVFKVSDHELTLNIRKFNTADVITLTKM